MSKAILNEEDTVFDKDIQKSDHFAFGFITDSIWDILNFSFCW